MSSLLKEGESSLKSCLATWLDAASEGGEEGSALGKHEGMSCAGHIISVYKKTYQEPNKYKNKPPQLNKNKNRNRVYYLSPSP